MEADIFVVLPLLFRYAGLLPGHSVMRLTEIMLCPSLFRDSSVMLTFFMVSVCRKGPGASNLLKEPTHLLFFFRFGCTRSRIFFRFCGCRNADSADPVTEIMLSSVILPLCFRYAGKIAKLKSNVSPYIRICGLTFF